MTDITTTDRRRVLVLNGHPSRSSLSAALAEEAAKAAGEAGAEVRLRHLQDMTFDPDPAEGYRARKDLEPDLIAFQTDLTWCGTLILVHPLWWGGPPAKLKGLFDRALLSGFAFASVEGEPLPDKLLAGRTARVLVTTDTPVWFLWLVYRHAWLGALRRRILDFTGLKLTMMKAVGPIRGARPGADKGWFAAAGRLAG